MRTGILAAAALLLAAGAASAQVTVDISLKRTLYMLYEPLVVRVSITNMSGRPLELGDTARDKWFGFQIETVDGRPVPPRDAAYSNEPVTLEPGKKLVRSINLTPLFPFEFGTYRVQATVFSKDLGRYFSSPTLNVEITEGRQIFEQTVGVPEGAGEGRDRTFTLLTHRLPTTTYLYLRVQDHERGRVFGCMPLGRFVSFGTPEVLFDRTNNIHVLQNAAPRVFLHSQVDVNGKIVKQQFYQAGKAKPILSRQPDGTIVALGGIPYDPKATPPEKQLPKLNDRPVPLPTPQTKATPEDKRPENLLSR